LKGSKVELVTIGDELLLGFTVNSNAAYISRELGKIGLEMVRHTTVSDKASEIRAAVHEALTRTGAVITTGGLGPTSDDLTKPAIAELFGRRMVFDQAVFDGIAKRWASLFPSRPFPSTNRGQAEIPEGATILVNRHGSAPGILLEDADGRFVAMLPGVPREMRGMLGEELLKILKRGAADRVVLSKTIRTTGIGESALAEVLGTDPLGDVRVDAPVSLAFLPSAYGADLRLTVRGASRSAAERSLDAAALKLREHIAPYVYAEDDTDLAAAVLDLCRARRATLAVAESCTGGMLGQRLTSVAGSSDVFFGGVIAYQNEIKRGLLDVRTTTLETHGAVSVEVAAEMASGVRRRLGTTAAVAITGIAGPGGGTPEKPVGFVCIALDLDAGQTSKAFRMIGDREEIRIRSTQAALDMLRRALQPV